MNHHRCHLISLGAVLILTSLGCSSDNDIVDPPPEPPPGPPAPEITQISPDSGKFGTEVTLTGSNFAATPEGNTVTFNGMEAAITSAGETELTAEVPQGAGSGLVSVTVDRQTADGPEFTYLPDNARFVNGETGADTGNDCNDLQSPCATIGYAISEAVSGDPIYIAQGAYTETLTIDKTLTLHGLGQDPLTGTVIQAHADSGKATSRVIFVSEGNVVSISDLTIRHGHVSGGGQSGRGGGIRVVGSTLNLTNVTLEKNKATYGGGIHNGSASGTYTNVTFTNNIAVLGSADNQGTGGGLYNSQSSPTLEGVVLLHNKADRHGGGVRNANNSSPLLVDVTFDANSATFGGGMYNSDGSAPTLVNVTFSANAASALGGGMYNSGSSPTLTNVTFSGNFASDQGGGMRNTNSSPNLTDVHFEGNEAEDGGGMYNTNNSSPTLKDVEFERNEAVSGGGLFNIENSSPTLTNVTFSRNSAGFLAGGMRNFSSSPVLTNVAFSGNSAGSYGGGVDNSTNSALRLINVTFDGNSAGVLGGGMQNFSSSPMLSNVTFSSNVANHGGGMSNEASSTPILTNVTFSGNSASAGGGMYNADSSPTLTNAVIWNNHANDSTTSTSASISNESQSEPVISYSLIANSGGSGDWNGSIGVDDGNNIDADPLFLEPIDPDDAPTIAGNLRLSEGSAAIDAGDPNTDPAVFATDEGGNAVDVDDQPRVVNGRIDIGAHENQGSGQ